MYNVKYRLSHDDLIELRATRSRAPAQSSKSIRNVLCTTSVELNCFSEISTYERIIIIPSLIDLHLRSFLKFCNFTLSSSNTRYYCAKFSLAYIFCDRKQTWHISDVRFCTARPSKLNNLHVRFISRFTRSKFRNSSTNVLQFSILKWKFERSNSDRSTKP